jgi:cleavage and polyadenylation specificity factor subunit 2
VSGSKTSERRDSWPWPVLALIQFEDYEIAQIAGRYVFHSNSTIPILEPSSSSTSSTITATPAASSSLSLQSSLPLQTLPASYYIGDLKLTLLKTKLQHLGIAAEFVGDGVLVCGAPDDGSEGGGGGGEVVAVRKGTRGRIEIEGGAGEIFYRVRKEVYALHAVVSGWKKGGRDGTNPRRKGPA